MGNFRTLLYGFITGAGMSVPGMSGGTIAILLGCYDKLLYSVSNILSDIKKNGLFLLIFAAGGGLGLLAYATVISRLLETPAQVPVRFMFLGAAAACVPPIAKKAELAPFSTKKAVLILAGVAAALGISLLPDGLIGTGSGLGGIVLQILEGIVVAFALVLPGISASQMLYMLSLYDHTMNCVATFDLLPLLPLAAGLLVGIFISAKVLSLLLEKTSRTFPVILGFLLFSLPSLIPSFSSHIELITGIICAAASFATVTILSSTEEKTAEFSSYSD